MIIGFDASRALIKDKTGTENYSYQLLKALAKIDRKNKYLIYLRYPISSTIAEHIGKYPKNFKFVEIRWAKLWTQAGLAWQTFLDDLDVLFVPAHTLPLIRKPGLKTVVTVHDLGSEYLPTMHQLKQRLYLSIMQKYQLKTATRIIAVSKATKNDLIKRLGIKKDKITVVYEGYDNKLFKPAKDDLSKTYVSAEQKGKVLRASSKISHTASKAGPYFLFVGTVQPRKNLTKLIQSFNQFCHPEGVKRPKHLDNIKLVIAGSKGWLSDDIYKLPKKLGIEDRVKFLGYVPDEKLAALYCGAQALVFPSLFEGFGLPILEAQACGCPVITSKLSSMPEVSGKGAILVDPYSIDDIVEGLRELQGTGYRLQLIKRGFENVKRFSWEKCARETLRVLNGVCGSSE